MFELLSEQQTILEMTSLRKPTENNLTAQQSDLQKTQGYTYILHTFIECNYAVN